MKRPLRLTVGTVIFLLVFATALYSQRVRVSDIVAEVSAPELPEAVGYEEIAQGIDGTEESIEPEDAEIHAVPSDPIVPSVPIVPSEINLAVPFTSQAPFANWDAVHEETCEEASAYMVAAYYQGITGRIDPQTADDELMRLIAIEQERFGFSYDTNAAQTGQFILEAYGLRSEVETNPTVESIRAHLAAGRPVIVPAAGRLLGNPNFSGDGPPYHMLVLRGYADGVFIANDPGTRRGEEYVYSEETIMNAMHDWTGSFETITSGPRSILVVYPE